MSWSLDEKSDLFYPKADQYSSTIYVRLVNSGHCSSGHNPNTRPQSLLFQLSAQRLLSAGLLPLLLTNLRPYAFLLSLASLPRHLQPPFFSWNIGRKTDDEGLPNGRDFGGYNRGTDEEGQAGRQVLA